MRLRDFHPMVECKPNDIQSCHDRIESLEDRIAYAKTLLKQAQFGLSEEYNLTKPAIKKFIAKLNKEGL